MEPIYNQVLKGTQGNYRVVEKLSSQGKHGVSFCGEDDGGKKVFIKTLRLLSDKPQINDEKQRINSLAAKFKNEFQNAQRLRGVEGIAQVIDHGVFDVELKGTTVGLPFLVQEFIEGITLREYVNEHLQRHGRQMMEEEWIRIVASMIATLDRVHSREVVHGDIHPGNFLVCDHRPFLIDFGQSLIRDLEEFSHDKPRYFSDYTPPEKCAPHTEGWEQPADIYSLGMTLFFLATGETIPRDAMLKLTQPFGLRNEVFGRVGSLNNDLLESNPCLIHVIVQALQINPHERASALQMETSIRAIAGAQIPDYAFDVAAIKGRVEDLNNTVQKLQGEPPEGPGNIIGSLLDLTVRIFRRKTIQAIKHNRIEVSGDRNDIINYLIYFLSHLRAKDRYWTITQPVFWQKQNLGNRGRFFEFNGTLARRGVAIRRLFIVSDDEKPDAKKHAEDVFRNHAKLANDLRFKGGINVEPVIDSFDGFYTGVKFFNSKDEMQKIISSGYLIGLAECGGSFYSLSFALETGGSSLIRRISIQRSDKNKAKEKMAEFCYLAQDAKNITSDSFIE